MFKGDEIEAYRWPKHMHSHTTRNPIALDISLLDHQEIVGWVGTEMALYGGERSEQGGDYVPPIWEHPSMPFLQLIDVDVQLADGTFYRLEAHLNDGSGFYGFHVFKLLNTPKYKKYDDTSIYRTRILSELPLGHASITQRRKSGPNATVEFMLDIGIHRMRFFAAEVYELKPGLLKIAEEDEAILLQVNGVRPAPIGQGKSPFAP
jgi:hypothetical protein